MFLNKTRVKYTPIFTLFEIFISLHTVGKGFLFFHYNFARIQFLLAYMCTGLGNEVSISPERINMSVSKDGVQSIKW